MVFWSGKQPHKRPQQQQGQPLPPAWLTTIMQHMLSLLSTQTVRCPLPSLLSVLQALTQAASG